MSVGVQIGPECVSGCGAHRSATAALGSGSALDGLAGNTIPASGDPEGAFQSSWHQFLEALGLRFSEEPAGGREDEAVSAPVVKPAPDQASNFSRPASGSKQETGGRMGVPREAPGVQSDLPAEKKAAGAGFKAPAQAHESRKGDGASTTSAAAGIEPAPGSQLVAVPVPFIAASQPPTGPGVGSEFFASESTGARKGTLFTPAVDGEAIAKGSFIRSTSEKTEDIPGNDLGDAPGAESLNSKGSAAFTGEEHNPTGTGAAGNPGWQEPGQDLNDALQAVHPVHAATEATIANAAASASTDSQLAVNAAPPADHRSASRSGRVVEPSLVRDAERAAHTRTGGESAGERGFSVVAAQDAGSPILVRDPVGIAEANGKQAGWGNTAHAAGNQAIGLTGEETFARLDAEGASPSIHWVQAGAHRAEAGYLDPALGWVGVRAETSGGGVHAALLPGSAEAAQVLGTHLSGLNAFLAEQHGPHSTATMDAPQYGRYWGGNGTREQRRRGKRERR